MQALSRAKAGSSNAENHTWHAEYDCADSSEETDDDVVSSDADSAHPDHHVDTFPDFGRGVDLDRNDNHVSKDEPGSKSDEGSRTNLQLQLQPVAGAKRRSAWPCESRERWTLALVGSCEGRHAECTVPLFCAKF